MPEGGCTEHLRFTSSTLAMFPYDEARRGSMDPLGGCQEQNYKPSSRSFVMSLLQLERTFQGYPAYCSGWVKVFFGQPRKLVWNRASPDVALGLRWRMQSLDVPHMFFSSTNCTETRNTHYTANAHQLEVQKGPKVLTVTITLPFVDDAIVLRL